MVAAWWISSMAGKKTEPSLVRAFWGAYMVDVSFCWWESRVHLLFSLFDSWSREWIWWNSCGSYWRWRWWLDLGETIRWRRRRNEQIYSVSLSAISDTLNDISSIYNDRLGTEVSTISACTIQISLDCTPARCTFVAVRSPCSLEGYDPFFLFHRTK